MTDRRPPRIVRAIRDPAAAIHFVFDLLSGPVARAVADRMLRRHLADAETAQSREPRIGIGWLNSAGQARAWAESVRRHGRFAAESFCRPSELLDVPCDRSFPVRDLRSRPRRLDQVRYVLATYTHLLLESGRSAFGNLHGPFFDDDLAFLAPAGIGIGVVLHGSDVRDPDDNARMEPYSPFKSGPGFETEAGWDDTVSKLRARSSELRTLLGAHPGVRRFVTTPGLLRYVPDATWLPVVVDVPPQPPPGGQTGSVPRVLHAPTNTRLKGSALIDPVCQDLHDGGVIEYVRPPPLKQSRFLEVLRGVDMVVDQVALGDGPTVTACQAMAAGKPVLAHVSDEARRNIDRHLPVIEVDPTTLESELTALAADPERIEETGIRGWEYVKDVHSGVRSAQALERFVLGESDTA